MACRLTAGANRLGSPWPCSWDLSVAEEARQSPARPAVSESGARGWFGAALSGLALVTVSLMLVIFFGFLDAIQYRSIVDFFTPEPAAAAGTLDLVVGDEVLTPILVIGYAV